MCRSVNPLSMHHLHTHVIWNPGRVARHSRHPTGTRLTSDQDGITGTLSSSTRHAMILTSPLRFSDRHITTDSARVLLGWASVANRVDGHATKPTPPECRSTYAVVHSTRNSVHHAPTVPRNYLT